MGKCPCANLYHFQLSHHSVKPPTFPLVGVNSSGTWTLIASLLPFCIPFCLSLHFIFIQLKPRFFCAVFLQVTSLYSSPGRGDQSPLNTKSTFCNTGCILLSCCVFPSLLDVRAGAMFFPAIQTPHRPITGGDNFSLKSACVPS